MVNIIVQHMFFVCFCLHVFLFVPGWDCCQARCQSDHRQLLQSAHRRCFVRTSGLGGLEYFWILKKESSCNRLIASTYQEVVLKMAMKGMFAEQHHANSWLSTCGITKVSFWGRHCFDRRHWPKASTSPSWMIITIIQTFEDLVVSSPRVEVPTRPAREEETFPRPVKVLALPAEHDKFEISEHFFG